MEQPASGNSDFPISGGFYARLDNQELQNLKAKKDFRGQLMKTKQEFPLQDY